MALNDKADKGAKAAAAEVQPEDWRIEEAKNQYREVHRALMFVGNFRVGLSMQTTTWQPATKVRRRGRVQAVPPRQPHDFRAYGGGKWKCSRCPVKGIQRGRQEEGGFPGVQGAGGAPEEGHQEGGRCC